MMINYNDGFIVSEYRSGKRINKITSDMFSAEKSNGNKEVKKYDCKNKVETAVLNYRLSADKSVS